MTVRKEECALPRSALAAGGGSVHLGAERDSAQQSRPSDPAALQHPVEDREHLRIFLREWCTLLVGLVARDAMQPGDLGLARRVDDTDRTSG